MRPDLARCLPLCADVPNDRRHTLGKIGEDLACAELRRLGYDILARRYRTRFGEIDIIARDDEVIAIVEVKTRVGGACGGGAAAVTGWKQQRIVRMATDYLARSRSLDRPVRFDVVVVDFEGGKPRVEVFPHAFSM